MATYQTKHSANKFWDGVLYHDATNHGPDPIPTLTTDSLNMGFALNATVHGTIVTGGAGVNERGFVWATHNNPTTADHKFISGTGPFTGAYSSMIGGLPFPATVYFAAYANSTGGTGYGNVLNGATQICFAEGTLITTASDRKKIEDVRYNDRLMVWNFDDGHFDVAKPVWMVQPFKANYYGLLKFDDGTELKTVADGRGHRIFNFEKSIFTYSMSEDTPIGTLTFTEKYDLIKLIDRQIIRKDTMFYNIVTHTHFNTFANGVLTSTGLNNIYPIDGMRFVKDNRKLASREEFADIPEELFVGLRLAEQPNDYYNIKEKVNNMMTRQWMV